MLSKGIWGCEDQEGQDQHQPGFWEGSRSYLLTHSLTATGLLEKHLEIPVRHKED